MLRSIILLVILIFLNAVFASAEIAVLSINESKLKRMSQAGDRKAKKLIKLTAQPAKFLATIQVAITLAGFLQSAFAAESFADPLVGVLLRTGIPISATVLKSVVIVLVTLVLAYFNLVFGELVPKRVAMKKSEKMALGMSGMLYGVSKIFSPVVWLLTVSTNGVLRLFGINPEEEEEPVTEEEIRFLLNEGEEQGNIAAEETELIENIFEFNDIPANEICTHRTDMVVLQKKDDSTLWRRIIMENRHTYYPVCNGDPDEILCVLDAKDYFRLGDQSKESILKNATEQPFFVPEGIKANVLFRKMQETRRYFAILLDEYGGVVGIVTLHDILETLVGELQEEEAPNVALPIQKEEDGSFTVFGTATLREVSDTLETELTHGEYDTFGGYICGLINRVPEDGECFECENEILHIRVLEVKNHVIGKTCVERKRSVAVDSNAKASE